MDKLISQIVEIASENKEGFTLYLPSLEFVKSGWVIANQGTQNKFGTSGLIEVVEYAMVYNRIVGGYLNADGVFQYDASIVEPNEQIAIALMRIHNQDCIYNLNTGKMIWKD